MQNDEIFEGTLPRQQHQEHDNTLLFSMKRENNYARNREYAYSVAIYQKYLTRLGELIILGTW